MVFKGVGTCRTPRNCRPRASSGKGMYGARRTPGSPVSLSFPGRRPRSQCGAEARQEHGAQACACETRGWRSILGDEAEKYFLTPRSPVLEHARTPSSGARERGKERRLLLPDLPGEAEGVEAIASFLPCARRE